MNRETRTLLVLSLLAILGVSSLGYLAQRYSKMALQRAPAVSQALVQVDAFIRVRRVLRLTIDTATPATLDESLRTARDRAIADVGLEPARYEEIREAYRQWRRGRLGLATPIGAALQRRGEELMLLDLGDYEVFDS